MRRVGIRSTSENFAARTAYGRAARAVRRDNMSASWGAPSQPPTAARAEGALAERARAKLLDESATIRAWFREASDKHGQMPAADFASCLGSLGMDPGRAPIIGVVQAHTSARGLVSCGPLLDEILGAPPAPAPAPASSRQQQQPSRQAWETAERQQQAPPLSSSQWGQRQKQQPHHQPVLQQPQQQPPPPQHQQPQQRASEAGYKYTGRLNRAGFSASPLHRLRQKWKAASYQNGRMDIQRLFKYYDRDNSGELDFDEFRVAARKDAKLTKQEVSDAALRKLFDRVDTDKGGTIGLDEFQELLEGDDGGSAQPEPTARSAEATAHRAPPRAAPARAGGSVAGSSGGSAGANTASKPPALRVLVRLQNFPIDRAMQGLQKFDPDDTGEVPVDAFVSVCKNVGLATDQISVLLKEHPRGRLGGRVTTVQYRDFIQHLTTPLGEVLAQAKLQTMLRPPQPPFSLPPSRLSERGENNSERNPSVAAGSAAGGVSASSAAASDNLVELMHGLSEDESKLSLELWKRCEELEEEVKASRQQLSEGGQEMVGESQQLMRQLREYQQQCKRETGESLTMVVESRRMLSIVSKEKEQVSQERDALAKELSALKLQLAKATVRPDRPH